MKKKACVTIVLIFVLGLFLSSTLFSFDRYVGPAAQSDELYWKNLMSFFDEFAKTVFEDPENPEDNIGEKNDEVEVDRRGHRIRKPPAVRRDKKFIEIDN